MARAWAVATRLGVLAVVIVGSWGTSGAIDAAPVTLRWKLQPGETLRYESAQTTTSRFKDPTGQEVTQTLTLTLDLTWKVKEVDSAGVATLTQTIDRIRTTAAMPFGKFSYDSKENGDASSPAGPIFKMLIGAEFTFKLNPMGEMSDIQLAEKLVNSLRSDKDAPGAQGQFSEAGLKNMLVQMGLILPATATEVGQTWNRKVSIPAGPAGESREVEQYYTYRGPQPGDKPLEVVAMSTEFPPIPPDPNVPVTITKQDASGSFQFDNQAGRISSSEVIEKAELTGQIQGQAITQSNETITKMTLQPNATP